MEHYFRGFVFFMFFAGFGTTAWAQTSAEKQRKSSDAAVGEESEGQVVDETVAAEGKSNGYGEKEDGASLAFRENSVSMCKDQVDNDQDTHIDCSDQDCQIFAMCVPEKVESSESKNEQATPTPVKETGKLCEDNIDNDENGLIDCHDPTCHPTRHCKREMYERPAPPNKPQGFFISSGMGIALPNFKWKDVRVDSVHGSNIPFDPDLGGMLNLKVGVAPLKWIGMGMNLNFGGTGASNRADFFSISDPDTEYKYDGYKVFGHIGGFIRVQYPAGRVVPYLDVAGGYSYARYKWKIYSGDTSWDDIDGDWDNDWNDSSADYEPKYKQDGHFTLALEPGFDVYVVERTFGVGARAWIPVYATNNGGMDNIGIMFTVTYTPNWREPKQLKAEYKK